MTPVAVLMAVLMAVVVVTAAKRVLAMCRTAARPGAAADPGGLQPAAIRLTAAGADRAGPG